VIIWISKTKVSRKPCKWKVNGVGSADIVIQYLCINVQNIKRNDKLSL